MGLFKVLQPKLDPIRDDPPVHFNLAQQRDRAASELIGLARGFLSDGAIDSGEAKTLLAWLASNEIYADRYPFDVLFRRVSSALADGVLDSEEEADLLGTLAALVGGPPPEGKVSLSTTLPLCNPQPVLSFEGTLWVVTGTFNYGVRATVVDAIASRGGELKPSVSAKVNYLVIGEIGSQAWRQSSYGRKIEKAVELRESGKPIAIISEAHWAASLNR